MSSLCPVPLCPPAFRLWSHWLRHRSRGWRTAVQELLFSMSKATTDPSRASAILPVNTNLCFPIRDKLGVAGKSWCSNDLWRLRLSCQVSSSCCRLELMVTMGEAAELTPCTSAIFPVSADLSLFALGWDGDATSGGTRHCWHGGVGGWHAFACGHHSRSNNTWPYASLAEARRDLDLNRNRHPTNPRTLQPMNRKVGGHIHVFWIVHLQGHKRMPFGSARILVHRNLN
mmetsp:Transcript_32369/g.81775  ORF Transcript_32369/g.81775 Transcript_32369/m.81775 type:complete len:229 (-) Transcript_32369:775-1461(-)